MPIVLNGMTHAEMIAEMQKPWCNKCAEYHYKRELQMWSKTYYADYKFDGADGMCFLKANKRAQYPAGRPVDNVCAQGCRHYDKGHKKYLDDCADYAAASERQYFSAIGD